MFRKLNTEELEKVSGGEIFKIIPTGSFVHFYIERNTDSEGNWSPWAAPELVRCCSPYYIVGLNLDSPYCFDTLAEAEQFARSEGYNTNVIDVINKIDL